MMAPDTMRVPNPNKKYYVNGEGVNTIEYCHDGTKHLHTDGGNLYIINPNGDVIKTQVNNPMYMYGGAGGGVMKYASTTNHLQAPPPTKNTKSSIKEQYPKLDSYIDLRVIGK